MKQFPVYFRAGLKGVGGLVTYDIGTKEEPAKIAIIYSLPYAYLFAWNWYGIRFIRPDDHADENLYNKMFTEESWHVPSHEWQRYNYVRNIIFCIHFMALWGIQKAMISFVNSLFSPQC